MRQPQSLPQAWARRRRQQRIFGLVVIAVMIAVVVYAWLKVFGIL
jgi:t-SNARE complex subunit (syntaxin)